MMIDRKLDIRTLSNVALTNYRMIVIHHTQGQQPYVYVLVGRDATRLVVVIVSMEVNESLLLYEWYIGLPNKVRTEIF